MSIIPVIIDVQSNDVTATCSDYTQEGDNKIIKVSEPKATVRMVMESHIPLVWLRHVT